MSGRGGNPFSPRVTLALVLFGMAAFVALLWMIDSGFGDPGPRASGAHARGKAINGYAALYDYLGKRGFQVSAVQSRAALKQPGLLILTPLHQADPKEIDKLVSSRRTIGPTLVILPKWIAIPLPRTSPKVKDGYVRLVGADTPDWKGFYDDITLERGALQTGSRPGAWEAAGLSGVMPEPKKVFFGDGKYVIPLVIGEGT